MTRTVIAQFPDTQKADRAVGAIKGGRFPVAVNRLRREGTKVMVSMEDEAAAARLQELLEDLDSVDVSIEEQTAVQTSGGQTEDEAPANWGDEGGASEWGKTVLRPSGVVEENQKR